MSEISLDKIGLEEIEIAQALAQMEKHQAEAEYTKWQARREELNYVKERLEYDFQLDGIYTFSKAVTTKSANRLLHAMAMWHHHDPERPWTIHLNSVGGDIYAGLSIIDELIAHSIRGGGTHRVTIKTRGVAASMAGMILQAGDHRVMGRNSILMIHKGHGGAHGRAEEIGDTAEWLRRDTDEMIRFFLERTDKITRPEFLRKINRKDWWIYPSEALALGFVDEVA